MDPKVGWIKVALEVNKKIHLTQLNLELEVECIIKGICEEHGICYEKGTFALKVQDNAKRVGTIYVTEENKLELKHGRQLKLSKSPAKRVGALINRLHTSNDAESSLRNLKSLAAASKDSAVLKEVHKQNALQHLRVFASVRSLSEDEYYRMYKIMGHLLAKDYLIQLCDDEVAHLMNMITGDQKTGTDMIILAFGILILLRKRGKLYWPTKHLRKLIPYVRFYGEAKLQEKALQFINALYLCANDSEEKHAVREFMKSSMMITYINKYVIRECLSEGMKHQLYLYQKIMLKKYVKQFEAVDLDEEKIVENLEYVISNITLVNRVGGMRISAEGIEKRKSETKREGDKAHQILKSLKVSLPPIGRQRTNSAGSSPASPFRERFESQGSDYENEIFLRKIETGMEANSITSAESAEEVFNEDEPTGYISRGILEREESGIFAEEVPALARDNLYYFIINDFHSFEKLMFIHKSNIRSVLMLSIRITALLCRIFEIDDKGPGIRKGSFVPLSFLYFDYFIEKIFSIAFKLFHQTRQEMGVAVESPEYLVVLKTVEDQLKMALETEPYEFVELENRLKELNAEVVMRKREELIHDDVKRQLTLEPGFIELREILTSRIMEKIKEKRLAFMENGEHVPQYDYKGQKIVGKRLVLSVSKVRDRFLVEECCSNPCKGQHKSIENVLISDIREIEYGSKSNFHKEVYYNLYSERDMFFRSGIKQHEPDLRFPISLKLHNLSYIDFCAGTELTMDYWIDGLRHLTGEKMDSENTKEEFEYLMGIELMSRLGELEGIRLPEKAPVVPPLPTNFNFVTD